MASQSELLQQARLLFELKKYDACLELLAPQISLDAEAAQLAAEAREKLKELCAEEEREVFLDDLKKEAMDLFDQEKFSSSLEKFTSLSRENPEDRTIQDYLRLCRQMLSESQASEGTPSIDSIEPDSATSSLRSESSQPLESVKTIHEEDNPTTPEQFEESIAASPPKKTLRILGLAALFLITIGIVWIWISWRQALSSLDIISEPEGAEVWLNGELKGKTHLHLEPLEAGTYNLKVEMPGFLTYSQQLMISKRQPTSISVKLARLPETMVNPEELLSTALVFFNQGNLMEAQLYCNRILEKEPQNSGALELKNRIYERLHPESFGGENMNPILPPPGSPPALSPSAPPAGLSTRQEKNVPSLSLPAPLASSRPIPAPAQPPRATSSQNQSASSFKVIHHHFVGSCRGLLSLKGNEVAFVPEGNSDEGFIRSYGDIEKIETGKNLKIQFKNKTFRFELAETADEMESRQKLVQISRQIIEKMAETKR